MDSSVRCPHCGSHVEALSYCGVCGRPLPRETDDVPIGWQRRIAASARSWLRRPVDGLAALAAVLAFLLLLGGVPALAIMVLLVLLPAAGLLALSSLDLYEQESRLVTGGIVIAAAVIGLVAAVLTTLVFNRFWFAANGLNLGAVGFIGSLARGEGHVSFGILVFNGVIVPLLAGIALFGLPIVARRSPSFRNETMDGLTLGGFAAGAFAVITGIAYFWPSLGTELPDRPVSGWTASLAGIVVVRPIVLVCAGSMIGWATWQYLTTRRLPSLVLPVVAGVFGWFGLPIGSLALAKASPVLELVWYVVVLAIVGVLFRHVVLRGRMSDRQVLATDDGQERVVCPNCHRVTPDGRYCAFCRAPLHPEDQSSGQAPGGAEAASDDRGADTDVGEPNGATEHEAAVAPGEPQDWAGDTDSDQDQSEEARLDDDGGPVSPQENDDALAADGSTTAEQVKSVGSDASAVDPSANSADAAEASRVAWWRAEPAADGATDRRDGDESKAAAPNSSGEQADEPSDSNDLENAALGEPDHSSTRSWVLSGPDRAMPMGGSVSPSSAADTDAALTENDETDKPSSTSDEAAEDPAGSLTATDETVPGGSVPSGRDDGNAESAKGATGETGPSSGEPGALSGPQTQTSRYEKTVGAPESSTDDGTGEHPDDVMPAPRPTPPGMRWFRAGDSAAATRRDEANDQGDTSVVAEQGPGRWETWRQKASRAGFQPSSLDAGGAADPTTEAVGAPPTSDRDDDSGQSPGDPERPSRGT